PSSLISHLVQFPDMCMCYTFIHVTLPLLIMNIMFCMAACNNAEYEVNGECCPMCDPGKQVKKHCDENTSTTCALCPAMTYTTSPNGLTECLPCFVCDTSNGLRVKQECTLISNTVCEPLSGYYCIDLLSSCKKAVKYSTCSPGQYINQTGQSFQKRYMCSSTRVRLSNSCEPLGKITIREGTDTTDAECSNGVPSYLLPLILSVCVLVVFITLIIVKKINCKYAGVNRVTNQMI
uniref:TNFR-Cys domain-containing protein n=1 Tax=Sinocyclocheilus rhinocerous TaxID=307959 RepID=A0A673HVT2_9TELE